MTNLIIDVYKENKFVRHLAPFELEMARRDVCFFYEEQKQWVTISGQLSFGYTFNLPYWDYLDLRGGVDEADKNFIRKGSLLLLLSECLEFFEDSGTFYLIDSKNFNALKSSVGVFQSTDHREKEIKDMILKLTRKIETNDNHWEEGWEKFLNRLFVTDIYGFFRNQLKTFDNHCEVLYLKYCEE